MHNNILQVIDANAPKPENQRSEERLEKYRNGNGAKINRVVGALVSSVHLFSPDGRLTQAPLQKEMRRKTLSGCDQIW